MNESLPHGHIDSPVLYEKRQRICHPPVGDVEDSDVVIEDCDNDDKRRLSVKRVVNQSGILSVLGKRCRTH